METCSNSVPPEEKVLRSILKNPSEVEPSEVEPPEVVKEKRVRISETTWIFKFEDQSFPNRRLEPEKGYISAAEEAEPPFIPPRSITKSRVEPVRINPSESYRKS